MVSLFCPKPLDQEDNSFSLVQNIRGNGHIDTNHFFIVNSLFGLYVIILFENWIQEDIPFEIQSEELFLEIPRVFVVTRVTTS